MAGIIEWIQRQPLELHRRHVTMQKTILEAIVGSTVHGTAVDDGLEDLDLMAVVLEDARHWSQ